MGLVYSTIKLANPVNNASAELEVTCLVDTCSTYLCIPSHVAVQLGLKESDTREVTLADGMSKSVPYVGPVKVMFEKRLCFVGALVIGNEVLLGAVPMEDMDLVVVPSVRRLVVNPLHPDFAAGPAK